MEINSILITLSSLTLFGLSLVIGMIYNLGKDKKKKDLYETKDPDIIINL